MVNMEVHSSLEHCTAIGAGAVSIEWVELGRRVWAAEGSFLRGCDVENIVGQGNTARKYSELQMRNEKFDIKLCLIDFSLEIKTENTQNIRASVLQSLLYRSRGLNSDGQRTLSLTRSANQAASLLPVRGALTSRVSDPETKSSISGRDWRGIIWRWLGLFWSSCRLTMAVPRKFPVFVYQETTCRYHQLCMVDNV